jgi:hypothetical protein
MFSTAWPVRVQFCVIQNLSGVDVDFYFLVSTGLLGSYTFRACQEIIGTQARGTCQAITKLQSHHLAQSILLTW